MSDRTPLWLDCDPGHDDVFAILLAAYHPSLNLLGISTVHGNASLSRTTANAGSVLEAIGRTDIPVYPGTTRPFCRKAVHAPDIHGESGLDGTDLLPKPTKPPITDTNAIWAMRNALLAQPKDTAWLVATGTLTNAALLFATFPEVAEHVKGVSIMGGAIGGGFSNAPLGTVQGEGERFGNITPWAEFNIYCDPESAASLLTNPILAPKTTLIPLDLTHQVLAEPPILHRLLHGNNNNNNKSTLRHLLHDLLTFFASTYATIFGITAGPPLHDPLAVAILLSSNSPSSSSNDQEQKISFPDNNGERYTINVITDGLHSDDTDPALSFGEGGGKSQLGRTVATLAETGVTVPRSVDTKAFWDVLLACVDTAEKACF